MEFIIKSGSPEKQRSSCVVVGVFESRKLSLAADLLNRASNQHLMEVIRRGDMEGKAGSTLMLYNVPGVVCERVLLVGLGKEKEFREREYCSAIRTAIKALNETGAIDAILFLTEIAVRKRGVMWNMRQAALVVQDTCYRFDEFKSKRSEVRRSLRKLTFIIERRSKFSDAEEAVRQGSAIAAGVTLAKNLGNLPSNVCNPTYLAERARKMAEESGIGCRILEREELIEEGMGALLAVAQGSHQPPKLVVLSWEGGNEGEKPVVLIGKGITFDTGGISLKPPAEMDEMKYDMCGAASVIGAMHAAAEMKLPLNIIGIIPATENMPGGSATRPGDIVTSLSGQTIEILNTDAEGRLILCDALSYAERFDPELVIDIATLTGACVIALGHVASGLLANNETLARELIAAGDEACDRAWQLPLWEDYQESLKSPFADMSNVGGRPAGTITAACFLSRFARKFDWAHLDIAGTAWKSGADKGATGRPVPLLVHYLLKRADGQQ
ncbi:MAG: leucyl aminopeptidase [Betaproteobacteria bacterium]|nr:leucyl aminopeptidase [Betaproteobacteria bacterium]